MNEHLNLFRFFSEGQNVVIIKNNLTRALALCLKHEPTFTQIFLNNIIEDYKEQCSQIQPDDPNPINIDIQVHTNSIDIEGVNKVYAVSLTTQGLSENDYPSKEGVGTNDPIADIEIKFNDVLIICEVNIENINCQDQLKNQIDKAVDKYKKEHQVGTEPNIQYKSLTWKDIITYLETSNVFRGNTKNVIITDFILFLLERYPDWFPIRKLVSISFPENNDDPSMNEIVERLQVITSLINIKKENPEDSENIPIKKDWGKQKPWAKMFNIYIGNYGIIDNGDSSIKIYCHPGDTKGQGKNLFSKEKKNWQWLEKHNDTIKFNEINGNIIIEPYIKFAHYRSGITRIWNIWSTEDAVKIFNHDNFWELTGQWKKDKWDELNEKMVSVIDPDWKNKCEWINKFENSKRNYVNISMAAKVAISFDYKEISKMDTNDEKLVNLFIESMDKIIEIIES